MAYISKERPILILGANGNLGSQITIQLKERFKDCVVAWTRNDCNVLDTEILRNKIINLNPSIIINTVAYNNVDAAEIQEAEKEKAIQLNVTLVKNLTDIAYEIQAKLIHFSTNYIFSGKKDEYIESDIGSPVNFYGLSKLNGEKYILSKIEEGLDATVIRISNLFGPRGTSASSKPGFFDIMLELSKKNEYLTVINDEFNCFTYTIDVAKKLSELITNDNFSGIFHFVNNESMSWYEAVQKFFELLGQNIDIRPIKGEAFKRSAKRPYKAALKSTKTSPLRSFEEAMTEYIEYYIKNNDTL